MEFKLPCKLYERLGRLALDVRYEGKEEYKSIYIENKNGKSIAVATNIRFAAIEYLGLTNQPDGSIALMIDDALMAQCITEAQFAGVINIVTIPEIGMETLKTMLGYTRTNDFARKLTYSAQWFAEWRKWLPDDLPTKTKGAMHMNADDVRVLSQASPSGSIVFPEFIDNNKPVVVRDTEDPNWCGAFMPRAVDETGRVYNPEGARLPEWLR